MNCFIAVSLHCPYCKAASHFTGRQVADAVKTGMRLVCSACRASSPAGDYLKRETEITDERSDTEPATP